MQALFVPANSELDWLILTDQRWVSDYSAVGCGVLVRSREAAVPRCPGLFPEVEGSLQFVHSQLAQVSLARLRAYLVACHF
jgi:hypothetical protein